jgi:hypothetical protein
MTVSPCNIGLSVFEWTTNSFWTENKKIERKQKHRSDSTWFLKNHLDPIVCNDFSCRSESTEKPILAVTDLCPCSIVEYYIFVCVWTFIFIQTKKDDRWKNSTTIFSDRCRLFSSSYDEKMHCKDGKSSYAYGGARTYTYDACKEGPYV